MSWRPRLCAVAMASHLAVSGIAAAQPLSPESAAQIQALMAAKAVRSPSERKVGSQLLYAGRQRRGLPAAPGVLFLRTGVDFDAAARALVDVRGEVSDRLLERIRSLGGEVLSAAPSRGALRAAVPLDAVLSVAELDEVRSVRSAGRAFTRQLDTSEGDIAHRADQTRSTFGIDGTGVRIGVLSDGVDSLAALQASSDLPTVSVLPGQAGTGDEGSAILEIVHDLAPGAGLLFATAFTSQASFAQNILDLRSAGADIIVDDVGYFAESVFGDDDVAAAVDTVVGDGAIYFASAGNAGNLNDGTGGVWEGDFVDSGEAVSGADVHDFGGATSNEITAASPFVYTLHWSDPKFAAANDYDLFLVNKPGKVILAASTDVQDGDDAPFEIIGAAFNDRRNRLLIAKNPGSATRMLHLNTNRGRLDVSTGGQIGGHPGARGAIAVAAVDVADAGDPTGAFDGSESVQTFSSDGPRRVFFEAGGAAITPGQFTSSGGEVRAKPDLAAADCVSTASPGFATFCGTSAAAPHAAAIAALLWELASGSGALPADLVAVLSGSAIDIEAPGTDSDSGTGIADSLAAASLLADSCTDGRDNDGDGATDLEDPGCDSDSDPSERSPSLPCDDGRDNDGDGWIDFRSDASGDPGCRTPDWAREDPECQDGANNDPGQDPDPGLVDFDGGQSIHGLCLAGACPAGVSDPDGDGVANTDPQCAVPWRDQEARARCGLGFELALILPGLIWLRRRRDGIAR